MLICWLFLRNLLDFICYPRHQTWTTDLEWTADIWTTDLEWIAYMDDRLGMDSLHGRQILNERMIYERQTWNDSWLWRRTSNGQQKLRHLTGTTDKEWTADIESGRGDGLEWTADMEWHLTGTTDMEWTADIEWHLAGETDMEWTADMEWHLAGETDMELSLIHIWRCRRHAQCRSRWSPYH